MVDSTPIAACNLKLNTSIFFISMKTETANTENSTDFESNLDVVSPLDGSVLATIEIARASTVNRAVEKAESAFKSWALTPIRDRAQVLSRFKQKVEENMDELAAIISRENGKTKGEAGDEIKRGLEVVEFATSIPNIPLDNTLEVSRGVRCQSEHAPLGVTLGITPFNFPAMVPMWMFPISLVCGNAFLLKPSEQTPLAAMKMAEYFAESGLPDGVFSVVNGDRETAQLLINSDPVKAIGFVGSTPVARSIYALAGQLGKRALALGGAKNHITLMPDADPEIATANIVASSMGCAGQRCMAASVLILVGDCSNLLQEIVRLASKIEVGKDMGAVISAAAKSRITGYIHQAESEGAQILLDGRKASSSASPDGFWVGPTIIDKVAPDSACIKDEIFGPVLSVLQVDSLDEALAIENASPFGNAASIYTTNGATAERYAAAANAGMVGVNIGVPVPRDPFPFGGWNASRFGVGDMTGTEGVRFWTQTKKITSKWSTKAARSWMS